MSDEEYEEHRLPIFALGPAPEWLDPSPFPGLLARMMRETYADLINDVGLPIWSRRPWERPDKPVMPVLVIFPWWDRIVRRAARIRGKIERIRHNLRDAARVARRGMPSYAEWDDEYGI